MTVLSYVERTKSTDSPLLKESQTLVLAGCFAGRANDIPAVLSGSRSFITLDPTCSSNAHESDMRIWRHVMQAKADRILVYSPDTDVYNIGLPIVHRRYPGAEKEVIVQINLPKVKESKYVHLNNLVGAVTNDADYGSIPTEDIVDVLTTVYAVSGCDYVSYFSGFGKGIFLNTIYQHASFITGRNSYGHLNETSEINRSRGFYSFLRLIGCLYFKKYYSAVVSLRNIDTPQQLLQSFSATDKEQQHKEWYNTIRSIVSDRITNEEERMPTMTSMWRHWLRSCWVLSMWQNSTQADLYSDLPKPEASGWVKSLQTGEYSIDWECPVVMSKVQTTIDFLTKGCGCKKGCSSKQCGCRKRGTSCGPSCHCLNCSNISESNSPRQQDDEDGASSDSSSESEEEQQ